MRSKFGIVEVDVRIAVAGGRDVHQPAARRDQRGDAVHQHEVAEVIGPELRLEPIGGVPERRAHHAGIGDHGVERPPVGEQGVGAGTHALKRGEIQLHQLQPAAVRRLSPDLGRRPLRLGEVARGADHLGPMRREGAGRLDPKAGRHAGDEHALSAEILAREHIICGGSRSERSGHSNLLHQWTHRSPRRQTIVRRPDLA